MNFLVKEIGGEVPNWRKCTWPHSVLTIHYWLANFERYDYDTCFHYSLSDQEGSVWKL